MTVLVISHDGGFTRLHQILEEVLPPMGIRFTAFHDQASGRAKLAEMPPKLLLVDVVVPLSPRHAGPPQPGTRVAEAFAETVDLVRGAHVNHPETRVVVLYPAQHGLEKAKKEEYLAIANVLEILPYPFSQSNQKKFTRQVQKVLTTGP